MAAVQTSEMKATLETFNIRLKLYLVIRIKEHGHSKNPLNPKLV